MQGVLRASLVKEFRLRWVEGVVGRKVLADVYILAVNAGSGVV